jgi:hypothetical protein
LQRTQDYHRQRQNFYYQSLHQAGIVCGLGVSVTPAPPEVEARYRDQRWVQLQPGIAIDAAGNPIIVEAPFLFRVQSTCTDDDPKTVFLVLNYVDPSELRFPQGQEWVRETFRLVEKTSLDQQDVELCRIQLQPGSLDLTNPEDVFAPGPNTLDLRHRQAIRDRPAGVVRVAALGESAAIAPTITPGFTHLSQAMTALYPALVGEVVPWEPPLTSSPPPPPVDVDLVYIPYSELPGLSLEHQSRLQRHVAAGGVVVIGVDSDQPRQQELARIRRELELALAEADTDPSVAAVAGAVQREIAEIDAEIDEFVQTIRQSVSHFATQLDLPLQGTGDIPVDHPLGTTPFLFSRWPDVGVQPLQLFNWGSVLLLMGNLVAAWGPDGTRSRSRDTIRTAHELGINLLHYAWRRRQLIQCQLAASPSAPISQPQSLTRQVTS